MFCPNCGAEIQDGSKFCSSCGASTGVSQQANSNQAVPKKGTTKTIKKSSSGFSVGKIIAIVVGFIFLVVIMVSCMSAFYLTKNENASTETAQTESNETAKNTRGDAKDKDNSVGKNLYKEKMKNGQEVVYGVSSNVVIAPVYAKEFNDSIGSKYHKATPQGKFIGVAVMIHNEQNDAITVNEAMFRLIDEKGREYSTSTKASVSWMMSHHSQEILTEINPGNDSIFTYFFDVPTNADIKSFKLQGRGGMMGDPVVVPINYIDDFKSWLD
ncbi:MAG: DUF4352 domain-containing protein [Selenomonas sp.]|uniref:DUF4352 domain-containing protein n=1 Tax=Selenomonas sp. TaxID=2053611 RepID=UPI0025CD6350|nr:DUF4352 domain-containing protein [Selenomonas sp.]MCR5439825.1 DUF4352 domain-containing protein [Selenomonas sp.]